MAVPAGAAGSGAAEPRADLGLVGREAGGTPAISGRITHQLAYPRRWSESEVKGQSQTSAGRLNRMCTSTSCALDARLGRSLLWAVRQCSMQIHLPCRCHCSFQARHNHCGGKYSLRCKGPLTRCRPVKRCLRARSAGLDRAGPLHSGQIEGAKCRSCQRLVTGWRPATEASNPQFDEFGTFFPSSMPAKQPGERRAPTI